MIFYIVTKLDRQQLSICVFTMASMSEIPFPEETNRLTKAYILTLIKPYFDEMSKVTDLETIYPWIEQVLPEMAPQFMEAQKEDNLDLQSFIQMVVNSMANLFDDSLSRSPWDLRANMDVLPERLFGAKSDSIEVMVLAGPNVFKHDLTVEDTRGIIDGLSFNNTTDIHLYVGDLEITPAMMVMELKDAPFTTMIGERQVTFNDESYVRGVNTAAAWNDIPSPITTVNVRQEDGSYIEMTVV